MGRHTIKKGQTEPLELTIDANNLSNLDNLDAASSEIYIRKVGESKNHVDGGPISVKNSADKTIEFDPEGNAADGGNAFDETGEYEAYVRAIWDPNGDETRHPDKGFEEIVVEETFE